MLNKPTSSKKRIIVTLSTGKQGAGVVKALASRNKSNPSAPPYEILAVTRDASSTKFQKLAYLPGVVALESDYNPSSIFEKAKSIGSGGPIYGVFSVQQSFDNPDGGIKGEVSQAKAMADEASKNGVKHFIYSSVDFGGLDATNIPHFESKREVETYVKLNHSTLPTTILRPVAFMDNFSDGSTFQGKVGNTAMTANLMKPLQLIACSDIGEFAALSFDSPKQYIGQTISLAGDELDANSIRMAYKEGKGSEMPTTYGFLGKAVLLVSKEMNSMFAFFNSNGYTADIEKLRQIHPAMKDFKTWAATEV